MRETPDILYSCSGHAITCIYMYSLLDIWNNNANIPELKIAPFHNRINQDLPEEEIDERDKHAKLIGQLK